MNANSIRHQALVLSAQERAELAYELIESLESLSPTELEGIWAEEAQRRAEQIDAQQVVLEPAETVALRARSSLR